MRVPAAVAALAALLAGCGDDELRPLSIQEYGFAAILSLCDWGTRCAYLPDDATCRRLLDPKSFDLRQAADEVAAGRLGFDGAAAARCAAATRAASCAAQPFAAPDCAVVFTGLVAQGEPCFLRAECAGHAPCVNPTCTRGCCAGRCGTPPDPPAPAPAPLPDGAACVSHGDCAETSFCDNDQRCHPQPTAEGQHCLFGCTTGDLYCEVATETCRRFAVLGAPCGRAAGGRRCSPSYAYCDPDATCHARPGAGETCDPTGTSDRLCVPKTRCDPVSQTCQARGGPGAACHADGDCDVACDGSAGTCVAYAACGS